uniref:Uncharacterized protein n=1 Tax=Cacopsylla melanoneura TaxID=428564 RepID=A0A8D8YZC7_9HEMI
MTLRRPSYPRGLSQTSAPGTGHTKASIECFQFTDAENRAHVMNLYTCTSIGFCAKHYVNKVLVSSLFQVKKSLSLNKFRRRDKNNSCSIVIIYVKSTRLEALYKIAYALFTYLKLNGQYTQRVMKT